MCSKVRRTQDIIWLRHAVHKTRSVFILLTRSIFFRTLSILWSISQSYRAASFFSSNSASICCLFSCISFSLLCLFSSSAARFCAMSSSPCRSSWGQQGGQPEVQSEQSHDERQKMHCLKVSNISASSLFLSHRLI